MDFIVVVVIAVVFFSLAYRFKFMRRKYLEPLFMGLMLFGIVAMSQPFFFWLYSNGFTILFPSTLAYIFSIHLEY